MNNKKALSYYDNLAARLSSPLEIRNKAKDTATLDYDFVKKYIGINDLILDLGSGTGLLVNLIGNDGYKVHAVEKYCEFARFINKKNVEVYLADVLEFDTSRKYNIVLAFGLLNFFSYSEALIIYERSLKWLTPEGKLIVKHQMGIEEDILIDGFSKELNTDYFSYYRMLKNEVNLLREAGYRNIEGHDIYNGAINRWANTRFYALVCSLR